MKRLILRTSLLATLLGLGMAVGCQYSDDTSSEGGEQSEDGYTESEGSALETCGNGVCEPNERQNKSSCLSDCVLTYPAFDQDIQSFLNRNDNVRYPVIAQGKADTVAHMVAFASSIGLPTSGVSTTAAGRQVRKAYTPDQKLGALLSVRLGDLRHKDFENASARKMWIRRLPAAPLADQTATSIAVASRQQFGLPILGAAESIAPVPVMTVSQVDGNASGAVLQSVGFKRSIGGRQVSNSIYKVEVDNATSAVSGMTLANWWPTGAAQGMPLKTATNLANDIKAAFARHAAQEDDVTITACVPTFYQLPDVLVASVSCYGAAAPPPGIDTQPDPIWLTVSMSPDHVFAASLVAPVPPHAPPPPPSAGSECTYSCTDDTMTTCGNGDEGDGEIAMYHGSTTVNSACDNLHEFEDEWMSKMPSWTSNGHWNDVTNHNEFFEESGTSPKYADESDVVYVTCHGSLTGPTGCGIYFRGASSVCRYKAGLSDTEVVFSDACFAGSPVYAGGNTAQTSFTDPPSSGRNGLFLGLHILAAQNGRNYGGDGKFEDLVDSIDDGVAIVEAWGDAGNDHALWLENAHCDKVTDPTLWGTTKWTCDRWSQYPGLFYVRTNKTDTKSDLGTADSIPSGSSELGVTYYHSGDTIPIYTVGKSLP